MAITNNAEGGTAGNTPTASDTGSGDTPDAVTVAAGATLTYDASHPHGGVLAYRYVVGATTGVRLTYTTKVVALGGTTSDHLHVRVYTWWETLNAAANGFSINVRSGAADQGIVGIGTTGKLRVRGNATSPTASSTNSVPTGQLVRIDVDVFPPSTTTGRVAARMYYGASLEDAAGSAIAADTADVSAVNTGAAAFDEVRLGEGFNTSVTFNYDDIAIDLTAPGPTSSGPAVDTSGPYLHLREQAPLSRIGPF